MMKKNISLILLLGVSVIAVAQKKGALDFSKNGAIEKDKAIAVKRDRKDKAFYYSKIESALMKAGYNISSSSVTGLTDVHGAKNYVESSQTREVNKADQVKEYKSFYLVEYHIGTEPKKGKNGYIFQISIFELGSGKMIATGSCTKSESYIKNNLEDLVAQFVQKLS
jgi:hypothetical protein